MGAEVFAINGLKLDPNEHRGRVVLNFNMADTETMEIEGNITRAEAVYLMHIALSLLITQDTD